MGKIINQNVDYINKMIDKRMDQDYTSYSRFLENAYIPVTYYHQNVVESTTDSGMGNVYGNNTSDSSAKRYNVIKDFPLYNINPANLDMDFEDNRIKAEFKSDGTVLPNTIIPIPEDYFVIKHDNRELVFKVTNFAVDNIKSNNFFKIEFKYESHDISHLNDDIVEQYTCIYEKIGTEDKCIIKDDNITFMQSLLSLYDDIRQSYLNEFYVARLDNFVFDNGTYKLYDPYLIKFISDNRLFEKEYSSNSYHILEVSEPLPGFNKKYSKSIYNIIQNKKKIESYYKNYRILRLVNLGYYFGNGRLEYKQIELHGNDDNVDLYNEEYMKLDIIPDANQTFINNTSIADETLINDEFDIECETILEIPYDFDLVLYNFNKLISLYLNGNSINTCTKFTLQNLNEVVLDYNFRYFIYTPMILYIIKYLIDNIKISN